MEIVDGNTPPYLHQEIIVNILKRLPVKSLIRFQCVCKNWKSLIKTPSFIIDHLRYSTHRSPSLLFKRDFPLQLYLLHCEMQLHEVQNPPRIESLPRVRIVGSSNGLLLLVRCSHFPVILSFFWWNPAIRQIRQVCRKGYDFPGDFHIGYGFSPTVNDYKILIAYAPELGDGVNQVEVYSFSIQSWKEIKFQNLKGVHLYSETATFNGVMFWIGSKFVMEEECEGKKLVVAFDIALETFTLIPMPVSGYNTIYKFTMHENKLGVIMHTIRSTYFPTDSSLIDLWVVEEGIGASQERWSWSKKYSTRRTLLGSSVPLGFWWMDPLCIWGDELVCNTSNDMSERESFLSLLNLRTNELKRIATSRPGNKFSVIFNHEESLVPIDSIHYEEA